MHHFVFTLLTITRLTEWLNVGICIEWNGIGIKRISKFTAISPPLHLSLRIFLFNAG